MIPRAQCDNQQHGILNSASVVTFLLTDGRVKRGVRHRVIIQAMNTATFHSRLGILGLSVRRFAAMRGVQYETARHWRVARHGHPQAFPLVLEVMDPSVS